MTQRAGFKNDLLGHKQEDPYDNQLDPEFLANRFAKKDDGRLPPLDTILDSKQMASIKTASNKKIEEAEKTRRSELSMSGIKRANTFDRKEADIIRNNSSAMLRDSLNMKSAPQIDRFGFRNDMAAKEDPSDYKRNPTNLSSILKETERKPDPVTPTAPSPIPKQEKPTNLDWRQIQNSEASVTGVSKLDSSQSGFAKSTTFPSNAPSNPYMGNKPSASATSINQPTSAAAGKNQGATKPSNSIIRETPEEDQWDEFDSGYNRSGQKRSDPKIKVDPKASMKGLDDFDEGWGDF